MKVAGDWLTHPGTVAVLDMLSGAGHEALVVGGAVRNALLGKPVDDIDIATSARPETVIDLAQAAGLRIVPTGIVHGTVTVIAQGRGFEVTSFRTDAETFGRHARVAFGADLAQDAARRDFTMNALYARADGTVIDPLGGLADLMARRVRFVGDAPTRIAEDALRILRFFRFHAQHGDPEAGLDPEGLAACAEAADALSRISVERITAEMRKLLAAPDPAPAMAAMAQSGVLARVLPGAQTRALPVLVHVEPRPGSWLARLAVTSDGAGLRLSRIEATTLARLRDAAGSALTPAALGADLRALAPEAILVRAALLETPPPADWQAEVARGQRARFPLDAADLMPRLSGAALGQALARARAAWLAGDLRPTRADLLALLGMA